MSDPPAEIVPAFVRAVVRARPDSAIASRAKQHGLSPRRTRVDRPIGDDVCMALPVRLDHCVIHVSDWDVSNAFYRDVVGAELVEMGGRLAYRFGDQQLNVHGPGVSPAQVARLPVRPGNSDLCFAWDGPIEDAVAHLDACGVAVELGPVERSGARGTGRSVYFRDPDGSLLEFIAYA